MSCKFLEELILYASSRYKRMEDTFEIRKDHGSSQTLGILARFCRFIRVESRSRHVSTIKVVY